MEIEVSQPNGTTDKVLQLPEILQNERGFPPLLSKTSGLVDDPFLPHCLFAEELIYTSIPNGIQFWNGRNMTFIQRQSEATCLFASSSLCTFADICLQ